MLAASLVGTSIEVYDFYVHPSCGGAGVQPAVLPVDIGDRSQLLSFAALAVAFIARPVEAIFWASLRRPHRAQVDARGFSC